MLRVCCRCGLIHDHKDKCSKRVATRNVTIQQDKLNRFYRSYQWQKLKNLKRREELYQCEICRLLEKIGYADEIHHIKKIGTVEGWEDRLDYDGLMAVCVDHHRRIDNEELNSKEEIFNYFLKKKN